MADPLRRTLLAKLRGKKSKKGATVGGGYGSAAAAASAANGGREGKEKVLQTQRDSDEARPVVLLTGLDCTAERMSTYENCVDGPVVQTGGVVIVRESRQELEFAGARPQERSSGGRVRVNEELLGVSLQRDVGHAFRQGHRSHHQGPRSGGHITLSAGVPHVQRKRFISVQRQCSVGDSIGFGDNSNHIPHRVRVETQTGVRKPAEGRVTAAGTDPGLSPHMAGTVLAVNECNANQTFDNNQTPETSSPLYAALIHPNCASRHAEESMLIRDVESYDPEYAGDIRGPAGSVQSPTFFPTELEICDINMTEASLRYTLDSEDDDYYDNEILPFYETVRARSEKSEVTELQQPGLDKDDSSSSSAQETDRLRNQLKEAYYLLINAMNDINMDVQQISGALTEQQATSSCSSRSRDSLCSRLSAKNIDSDSWSSGGDHSPQQVSDTDSLLLCLTGKLESGLKGRLNSKSMINLSFTKVRSKLARSASDGAIRYSGGPSQTTETCGDKAAEITEAEREKVSGPRGLCSATSSDELLQDPGADEDRGGPLNESSGSVNSLTGSSDSNQGQDNKQEARLQGASSANKGPGVTVNKMQEWMHKGRLLSSEMKQRIEGASSSSSHCGGSQSQNHRVKSVKAKSPTIKTRQQQQQQQQPGRKTTRSRLNSCGSSKIKDLSLLIVILLHS